MKNRPELETIVLDHGTGGLLSQELVTSFIIPILGQTYLGKMEDSAILNINAKTIAITTDSFVVDPIFFGNGNIGKISICGTVNDLAVSGAKPLYLTLSMVIEAGLPLADLKKILESIASTSQEADVRIVAGDTKVVRKGEVDKIFINTSGIGVFRKDSTKLTMPSIKEDDDVIVTGQIGNHSVHILSIREGLGYEERVLSDCAPLNKMIGKVLKKHTNNIHYMRDLTRGGLGSALNEISTVIKKSIEIRSYDIPIQQETQMAADMLGINPIYLANEGTLVIFCSPDVSNDVIAILKADKYGKKSSIIGKVKTKQENHVISVNKDGEIKIIDHLYGQELPRLC